MDTAGRIARAAVGQALAHMADPQVLENLPSNRTMTIDWFNMLQYHYICFAICVIDIPFKINYIYL